MADKERWLHVRTRAERYGRPQDEQSSTRDAVFKELRRIAMGFRSRYRMTGAERYLKQAERLEKQALRFRFCGLEYVILNCLDCETVYAVPARCEMRICLYCSRLYGTRIRKKYEPHLRQLQRSRGKWPMALTATKRYDPNQKFTGEDVRELFGKFHQLMDEFYPKSRGCGAFAVFEFGPNGNPHIHAIVYGYYVPQEVLAARWEELTGDSKNLWIKALRRDRGWIHYILKYVTKPVFGADPRRLAEYMVAMQGVRRIRTFGIFYNMISALSERLGCLFCSGWLRLRKLGNLLDLDGALFFSPDPRLRVEVS